MTQVHGTLNVCLVREMEKWEDRKELVFPHLCLVRHVEKWKDEKKFYLVGKKNRTMEKKDWYKFTIISLLNKTKGNTFFY